MCTVAGRKRRSFSWPRVACEWKRDHFVSMGVDGMTPVANVIGVAHMIRPAKDSFIYCPGSSLIFHFLATWPTTMSISRLKSSPEMLEKRVRQKWKTVRICWACPKARSRELNRLRRVWIPKLTRELCSFSGNLWLTWVRAFPVFRANKVIIWDNGYVDVQLLF